MDVNGQLRAPAAFASGKEAQHPLTRTLHIHLSSLLRTDEAVLPLPHTFQGMMLNGAQTPLSVYLLHDGVCRFVIFNVNSLSRLYTTVANLQGII